MTHPALFIGHGSPMNTLEMNRYTRAWGEIGRLLPKPRAILMISAHWYFGATAVTVSGLNQTRCPSSRLFELFSGGTLTFNHGHARMKGTALFANGIS